MKKKVAVIGAELRAHAPFTFLGALSGIVCMVLFKGLEYRTSHTIFYLFHPAHVLLSALVTASVFSLHSKRRSIGLVLVIGVIGSLGIATLSDSLIPYIGELLLGRAVDVHAHGTEQPAEGPGRAEPSAEPAEHPGRAAEAQPSEHGELEQMHIGFIEAWYVVLPVAIIGSLVAYFWPRTRFPHAGHVLLSTWASSFHMLMAFGGQIPAWKLAGSGAFLFLAVWLPCCISDIVFPLIFADSRQVVGCGHHRGEGRSDR